MSLPRLRAPRFLPSLEETLTNDDKGWIANCPICDCDGMTIRPDDVLGLWIFTCPDGCGHREVVEWLSVDIRLFPEEVDEAASRAWAALMLAPTPEIWAALLDGEYVADHQLDQRWLRTFKAAGAMLSRP